MGYFKNQVIDESLQPTPLARELRAVVTIMAADPELVKKALPHVNIDTREINWDEIFKNNFGSGHRAALLMAKAIWCDRVTNELDPFPHAPGMDARLQQAVLRGLAIRWGLAS